ncbi:unnamed protein product [Closterium sp. NIES-54]
MVPPARVRPHTIEWRLVSTECGRTSAAKRIRYLLLLLSAYSFRVRQVRAGDVMGEAVRVKEVAAAAAHGAPSGADMQIAGGHGASSEVANVIPHAPDNPEEVGPYVPIEFRNDQERKRLKSQPLGMHISSDEQTAVWLNYFKPNTLNGPKLSCMGLPCPHFLQCIDGFPNVWASWNGELVDKEMFPTHAPLNCPIRAAREEKVVAGEEEGEYDLSCSHRKDYWYHMPWALQNFQLANVYITHDGFLFNATHQFMRGGCHQVGKYTFSPAAAVHELHGAWSWAYLMGGNFYHVLVEMLPCFLVAARLFQKYRKYPILATGNQWRAYDRMGAAITGIPRASMRALATFPGEVYHAAWVHQPMFQFCGTPSRALWHTIRSRHFLHPDGLPLFNPDWTYRDLPPLTDAQMALLPADWVVVLAKRPGRKRAIINFAELESAVKKIFPNRVVTYNGSMGILEARDLFRRAWLYIGGHGAALANMVFMPAQATVLEIRPNGCPNTCYHQLSYACSLRYHLVLSDGTCYSPVVAHVNRTVEPLEIIARYFLEKDTNKGDVMGEAVQVKEGAAAAAEGMEVAGANGASGSGALPEMANVFPHAPDSPEEVGPYVPIEFRNDQERVRLKSRPLGMHISSDEQTHVWLNYFQESPLDGPKLSCMGNPCPHLYKCHDGYPNVWACWTSELVDRELFVTHAPLNCPNRAAGEEVGDEEGEYDESCSHKADHGLRMPWALQNFQLSDVYITHDGFLFNATHQFVRGGCHHIGKYTFSPTAAVHELHGAWSWAYVVGGNFYHVLVETLPCFVVAARFLSKYRAYPVVATGEQWRAYNRMGAAITGIPRASMRALATFPGEVYHAARVHQPMFQQCGTPSRALWHTIRSRHFLHPDGLPLFNPDWTYRDLPPLSNAQMALLPSDWVVVLAKRPGRKRAIINFAELESAVKRIFPDRVVMFNGSMGILEARDLFRRARLYIGGHGAALANMVFMPTQATVLEIRPNGCANTCFHQLSYACSIRYHLVLSDGTCFSSVEAHVDKTVEALESIARNFSEEDATNGSRQ